MVSRLWGAGGGGGGGGGRKTHMSLEGGSPYQYSLSQTQTFFGCRFKIIIADAL